MTQHPLRTSCRSSRSATAFESSRTLPLSVDAITWITSSFSVSLSSGAVCPRLEGEV